MLFQCRLFDKKGSKGFSLPEVLIASALFSGMVAVMLAAFVNAKRLSAPALDRGESANLARAELERLYIDVDQNLWDLTDSSQTGLPSSEEPTQINLPDVSQNGKTFSSSYTVANVDGRQYRKVTMKVDDNAS